MFVHRDGMHSKDSKTVTAQKYPHMEKVLAEIKAEHPDFIPNENTLSLLRGLDDLVHGRVKEWNPKTKKFEAIRSASKRTVYSDKNYS